MASHQILLPPGQLAPLEADYAKARSAKRFAAVLVLAGLAIAMLGAGHVSEIDLAKLWTHRGEFGDYFNRIFTLDTGGRTWSDPVEWFWNLKRWSVLLVETVVMSYVGTALGFIVGLPLCFAASANLSSNAWVRGIAKRLLELLRTVPDLVFALIFVEAFGLGPLAGVLALALHSTGALGKLFSEFVENVDMKPVEGVIASGGGKLAAIRFGVLPQVLSGFASYTLLRFEINVREAAVLGYVGAGGIGEKLIEAIRKFYYTDVSAILILLIATVFLIDMGTDRLRAGLSRAIVK
ncbi:phosphonate transport system permease protein [Rhizobiales bacterium GAS191]|nr:phosphonate transport system permease protein [Rhizobiales bacterium GAS113]SED26027.1 phosphonate transport system permease protein [Rhizobiales bacterium GAS191]